MLNVLVNFLEYIDFLAWAGQMFFPLKFLEQKFWE